MARPRKTPDTATGTVQARHAAERERQKTAATLRQAEMDATLEAQKATAKRLKDKPTDSRTLATPDPNA